MFTQAENADTNDRNVSSEVYISTCLPVSTRRAELWLLLLACSCRRISRSFSWGQHSAELREQQCRWCSSSLHGAHHAQGSLPSLLKVFPLCSPVSIAGLHYSMLVGLKHWSELTSWVCQVTAICDALRICPNPRAGIPVLLQLKESTELSAAVKRWCICAKILHYINAYI